jgi:hypothetical protein
MKRTTCVTVALAALIGCTVALPAIAQITATKPNAMMQDPNSQPPGTGRRQRTRRTTPNQPRRRSETPAPMAVAPIQPVTSEFQRTVERADQTLDNIVKLLDSIDARKAGTTPAAQ